jgi:hypothetical protein
MHLSPLKRTMIRERMERMKREIKEDPSRYPYPITRE